MFCYQCEQAAKGTGCEKVGVCGKSPQVSELQDLLEHALRGLALYAVEAEKEGIASDPAVNAFTADALFTTLTNVNFDGRSIAGLVRRGVELREGLKKKVSKTFDHKAATFTPADDYEGMVAQSEQVGIMSLSDDPDIRSLMHTTLYGLKGVAAYAVHARTLGQEDNGVYAFMHEALASMLSKDLTLNDWVAMALKCGEVNLRAMELLDTANTGTYGHPEPTSSSTLSGFRPMLRR